MRKLTMMLLLSIATFSAKAALFINNSSSCMVVLVIYGHDANNLGPCAYYSTRLDVPAGSSFAYNNVTSLNAPGLGWNQWGVGAVTAVLPSSGFDAIQIWSTDPTGPHTIGNPGTCATGTSVNATTASCPFTANWTQIGGGNTLLNIN